MFTIDLYSSIFNLNEVLYISGFLFIENKSFKKSFKKFFAGKVKRLLVPWILWMILSQIVSAPFGLYDGTFDLKKIILSLLKDGLLYCNNLWFLPALFISEVIFYWVSKLINKISNKNNESAFYFACSCVFWLASYIENRLIEVPLFFKLDVCLMAIAYISLGASMNVISKKIYSSRHTIAKLFAAFALSVVSVVAAVMNGRDNAMIMVSNKYGNYFLSIIGAASLIIVCIILVSVILWLPKKYLLFLRNNSLMLFPIHTIVIRCLNHIPNFESLNLWIYSAICLIVIHLLIYPICKFINKYFPILNGK